MDLSDDLFNNREQIQSPATRRGRQDVQQNSPDILDLSNIDLDNEETWLYEAECKTDVKCREWLHEEQDYIPQHTNLKTLKNIDTRTFTRPKKRLIRPSIEQYEQLYSDSNEMTSSAELILSSGSKLSEKIVEEESDPVATRKPLNFDLSQPVNNFDSFMINSVGLDSFQNMSPPSLVNSLCSSTFANLMENSFIKNDPVLREIRDKDFTETALLQDTEAPMFQSITESCSSINSDTPESFLRRVSFNNSFRKTNTTITCDTVQENNSSSDDSNNATFQVQHNTSSDSILLQKAESNNVKSGICDQLTSTNANNGTYRRMPKLNGTFRKSDLKNNRLSLNLTYETHNENFLDKNASKSMEKDLSKRSSEDLSRSSIILPSNSIEDMKKRYSMSDVPKTDLNRLSYCTEDSVNQMNTGCKDQFVDLNRTVDIKRSSLGSADSLDRMSSLSSSSKGSNKMLNMSDIDAIVEMQERSLNQAMSTPKPNVVAKKIWNNTFISPIRSTKEHLSDSELSCEEYKSVRTSISSNYPKLAAKTTSQKPLQAFSNNIRGSYSNLKTVSSNMGGSQTALYRPNNLLQRGPSQSNLKTMSGKLKGSYTSLRPISANLPVVPPAEPKAKPQPSKPAELSSVKEKVDANGTFVKPQLPRSSGLPRPTGIPRPASRIPAPRSSNIRPSYSRTSNY